MKVLVTGNEHPNEVQSTRIFNALKEESNNPNIQFLFVPFEETMQGYMNKALKVLSNKNEVERRLVDCNKREKSMAHVLIDDIRNPADKNKERALEIACGLNHFGAFYDAFPEIVNAFDPKIHINFVLSELEKSGADFITSLHSTHPTSYFFWRNKETKHGHERCPYIYMFSKRGEEIGLNQSLCRKLGEDNIEFEYQKSNGDYAIKTCCKPRYCIEVPAIAVESSFIKRAINRSHEYNGATADAYYGTFFDARLPINMKNFEFQKKETKKIVDSIVSFS